MSDFVYPVNLGRAEEGGYVVTFPDIPEAITQGEDKSEALMRAVDALETALEIYTQDYEDLPRPSRPKRGQHTVSPSLQVAMKLAIYQAMRDQGVRKAELAKRLGWHLPQVDRLLDLRHGTRLSQVEAAAASLGRKLELHVHR